MADDHVVAENPLGLKEYEVEFSVKVMGKIKVHAEGPGEATRLVMYLKKETVSEDELLNWSEDRTLAIPAVQNVVEVVDG